MTDLSQFLIYKAKYEASQKASVPIASASTSGPSKILFIYLFIWYILINSIALLSTDSWMEKLIRKKKKKDRTEVLYSENPFEEIERYFKLLRLWREDCPNPIPWWGVSCILFNFLKSYYHHSSFTLKSQSSVSWHETILLSQLQHVLPSALFHSRHAPMIHNGNKWRRPYLEDFKSFVRVTWMAV